MSSINAELLFSHGIASESKMHKADDSYKNETCDEDEEDELKEDRKSIADLNLENDSNIHENSSKFIYIYI